MQCWDAFTKNSDWVRRADLFEKEADEGNSCSRFDVWLMLAQKLVGGFGLHRPFVVELEATTFSFNGKPQATPNWDLSRNAARHELIGGSVFRAL